MPPLTRYETSTRSRAGALVTLLEALVARGQGYWLRNSLAVIAGMDDAVKWRVLPVTMTTA